MTEKFSFENKALKAINQYEMLNNVRRVIVALSGGADSMSLLYFLHSKQDELNITVEAAHLNHNIRGAEAQRDADFVAEYCRSIGVKLHYRSVDIPALADRQRLGHEECGRRERYSFFAELCADDARTVTATAHTASDNAETVLLNITRGCGLNGLCGIPPVRENVIRPLILCTRREIEAYCTRNNIPFVTDSTNLSSEYSRNRIRLSVIPQLETINPSIVASLNRLSSVSRGDSELIKRLARKEINSCAAGQGFSVDKLKCADTALLPHIIKILAEDRLNVIPEKRQLDLITEIISKGSGAVQLRANKYVSIKAGLLLFTESVSKDKVKDDYQPEYDFEPGMSFLFDEKYIEISRKMFSEPKINKKLLIDCISCGIISDDTKIRYRKSGDVFSPYGRGCTKTVKKLFKELKIPLEERSKRLLIANGSKVLWIEGIGASQDAAPVNEECFYEIKSGVCRQ